MKNHENVETVNASRHAKLRVKPNPNMEHAKDLHLAAAMLNELSPCSSNFPLVFIQNQENQRMRLVAMMGIRVGENVFYDAEGWAGTYIPLVIQQHPFVLGFDDRIQENEKVLASCLDRSSSYISEDDGIALFTETGEETDFLKSRNQMLSTIFEGEKLTEQFTRKMVELDLLVPLEVVLQQPNGDMRRVTGLQTVSERKLRDLAPAQLEELHKLDYLPACYLILGSLFQLHRIVRLRNQKGDDPIVAIRVELEPQDAAPQQMAAQQEGQAQAN
ncbi:MAG TPA: SapC family protein [Pseudomonadaceae bacterium]|nr:SapC family protein [Pseudomonadaceae bacterium]